MKLTVNQCKLIGVFDKGEVKKLQKRYSSYDELHLSLSKDPYIIYVNFLGWNFSRADKLILQKFPEFEYSEIRCKYGMITCLKYDSNINGNTRMYAKDMFVMLKKLIGKCSDFCVKCTDDSAFIFDPTDKTIGLKYLYDAEKNIAEQIKKRLQNSKSCDWDIEKYRNIDGMKFTDEQMTILQFARDNNIAILNGGAGCGKSAVTKALVAMLKDNKQKYTMVAPTGIAAKRLREATGEYATTIHYFLLDNVPHTNLDYLIIDEFSMVGVELLNLLLNCEYITPKTRIIFICDETQLASISCGNIIKNLLDYGKIPTAKLTKVFRYGIGGVSTIATDIRNGKMPDLEKEWEDCISYEYDNSIDSVSAVLRLATKEYNLNDILLLTPKKIGDNGTHRLNRAIQKEYSHGNHLQEFDYIIKDRGQEYPVSFNIGDKVINIKNNYNALTSDGENAMIMNGEIGIVVGVRNVDDETCLCVQFDNAEIAYGKKEIRNLQLAYALTCHKVQGQQAKCVIFLAEPSSAFMLTRNLMYVAVSRAQEMLYIIGDENTISDGINKVETNKRMTYLNKLLEEC